MLISTALKNGMYIDEYGLTYKRIGVFIYLLLTSIGLITTYIKIAQHKTASFLIRINSWLFYFVLVVSCFVNWDLVITNYNIRHSGNRTKTYLLYLSETNLPQLFKIEKEERATLLSASIDSISEGQRVAQIKLSTKLFDFFLTDEQVDWRSWNYDRMRVKNELSDMNSRSEIISIRLPHRGLYDLMSLKNFWNITDLDIGNNYVQSFSAISYFPGLIKLDVSWNRLTKLDGIENFQKLEVIDLRGNLISNYSLLLNLKNLKEVHLSADIPQQQLDLLTNNFPGLKIYKH